MLIISQQSYYGEKEKEKGERGREREERGGGKERDLEGYTHKQLRQDLKNIIISVNKNSDSRDWVAERIGLRSQEIWL